MFLFIIEASKKASFPQIGPGNLSMLLLWFLLSATLQLHGLITTFLSLLIINGGEKGSWFVFLSSLMPKDHLLPESLCKCLWIKFPMLCGVSLSSVAASGI